MVRYDGVPRTLIDLSVPDEPLPYGWIHTDDGAVVVSEPEGSANWFPLNDHPTDKAAFTFVVTVPAGLTAVSNGRLVGHRTRGRRVTWVWEEPEPMAPYLATATIGRFDLRGYRTSKGLRMYDAVDPDLYDQPADPQGPASPSLGEIADGRWAARARSPASCPGGSGPTRSSGGGIVDDAPDLFFALENQTRPTYPGSFFPDPVDGDVLVVHELANQWFGDSVALAEWKPSFSDPVYLRGAMTLQALRGQFIALAERISGRQLDALFTTWLFTPAKPPLPRRRRRPRPRPPAGRRPRL